MRAFGIATKEVGEILDALDRRGVSAVVINEPLFSGAPPPDLVASLASRYSHESQVERFTVRWRE